MNQLLFMISPIDISLFVIIFNRFQDTILKDITQEQKEGATSRLKHFNKVVKHKFASVDLNIKPIIILLCEDNRSFIPPLPLLRITLKEAAFNFNLKNEESFKFEYGLYSLDFYNKNTGKYDVILEPVLFDFSFNKRPPSTKDISVFFNSDININISYHMLSSILSFSQKVTQLKSIHQKTFQLLPKINISNKTSLPITISTENKEVESLTLSSCEELPLYKTDNNTNIILTIGSKMKSFSANQLSYPLFPFEGYVIYKMHEKTTTVVTISSTVLFINKTNYCLDLFYEYQKTYNHIAKLEPNVEVPLSEFIDLRTSFVLCSGKTSSDHHPFKLKPLKKPKHIVANVTFTKLPIILYRKLNQEKGVSIVEILSPIKFVNNLPFASTFFYQGNSIPLKRNESKAADYIPSNSLFFNMKIIMPNGITSQDTIIALEDNRITPIKFLLNGQKFLYNFAALVSKDEKTTQITISFFVPALFFNTTLIPLSIYDQEKKIINSFTPVNSKDYTMSLWGLDTFFKEEKSSHLAYIIANKDYGISTKPIDTLVSAVDDFVLLQNLHHPKEFLPIHYAVESIDKMSIITLSYHFTIANNLDFEFFLQGIDDFKSKIPVGSSFILKPKEKKPLLSTSHEFKFLFVVNEFIPVELSFANPITTTFRCVSKKGKELLINILILHTKKGMMISFSPISDNEPIMINNTLPNFPIVAYQHKGLPPITIKPNEIRPFAFDYPEKDNKIFIGIASDEIQVSMKNLNKPQKIAIRQPAMQLLLEVRTNKMGSKIIIISNDNQSIPKDINTSYKFSLPRISVSLIDEKLRELSLLTLTNIYFEYKIINNLNDIKFIIKSFQIDDMYPDVPLPVAVFSIPKENHQQFLIFEASFYRKAAFAQAFKNFTLKIQPITAYIDVNFASEMINFFYSLTKNTNNNKPIKPAETQTNSSKIISFEQFKLYPINITVSLRPHTTRVKHKPYMFRIFHIIPSVTNAHIILQGTGFNGMDITTNYIKSHIIQMYKKSLIDQALKMIGHMDFLFNISEVSRVFEKNITHISQGEFDEVNPGAVIAAPLSGAESFVRGTSGLMHAYLEGDNNMHAGGLNRNAAETLGDGFVSFGKGIAKGLTGIVTKPIEEGKKGGFLGGIKGVGKGLIGAVASPVSGLLDIGAGVIGGTAKLLSDDNFTIERIRIPHAYLMKQIGKFSHSVDLAQLNLQTYKLLRTTYNQTLLFFFRAKDFYVGITQKCLWLFDNNSEVVAYYKLKRIQTVQTNSNYLFIRFISPEETIKLLSQSEEIANYSLQILMSLSIICKTNSKF